MENYWSLLKYDCVHCLWKNPFTLLPQRMLLHLWSHLISPHFRTSLASRSEQFSIAKNTLEGAHDSKYSTKYLYREEGTALFYTSFNSTHQPSQQAFPISTFFPLYFPLYLFICNSSSHALSSFFLTLFSQTILTFQSLKCISQFHPSLPSSPTPLLSRVPSSRPKTQHRPTTPTPTQHLHTIPLDQAEPQPLPTTAIQPKQVPPLPTTQPDQSPHPPSPSPSTPWKNGTKTPLKTRSTHTFFAPATLLMPQSLIPQSSASDEVAEILVKRQLGLPCALIPSSKAVAFMSVLWEASVVCPIQQTHLYSS